MKQQKHAWISTVRYWLSVVIVGVVVGFSLQFVRAWVEPSANPPGGNVGAPINTSANGQLKHGPLSVLGQLYTAGNLVLEANTTMWSPGRLHVYGGEVLYILNKSGVTIGKEWGGNGNLHVQGTQWIDGALRVANSIWMAPNTTLRGEGRMHMYGTELLYILNTSGVIIGKEWGGNGNLQVQGNLNLPTGAGAGKVLTSDARGNASWQNNSSGSSCSGSTQLPRDCTYCFDGRCGRPKQIVCTPSGWACVEWPPADPGSPNGQN